MSDDQDNIRKLEIAPGKSDHDIAQDLIRRMEEALKPVAALMDEAAAAGVTINLGQIQPLPPFYKHQVVGVSVMKLFLKK